MNRSALSRMASGTLIKLRATVSFRSMFSVRRANRFIRALRSQPRDDRFGTSGKYTRPCCCFDRLILAVPPMLDHHQQRPASARPVKVMQFQRNRAIRSREAQSIFAPSDVANPPRSRMKARTGCLVQDLPAVEKVAVVYAAHIAPPLKARRHDAQARTIRGKILSRPAPRLEVPANRAMPELHMIDLLQRRSAVGVISLGGGFGGLLPLTSELSVYRS